jgi:hypothetical protein
MVSDGGAKEDLSSSAESFSGNAKARHSAWIHAPLAQKESYGLLSVMIFLELYIQFFQVTVSDKVEHLFYCNNQGILKRMVSSQENAWDNPNHCLASEYDVESGIVDILASTTPFQVLLHPCQGPPR